MTASSNQHTHLVDECDAQTALPLVFRRIAAHSKSEFGVADEQFWVQPPAACQNARKGLIVRKPEGTIWYRNGSDIKLNGQLVDQSWLKQNDVLETNGLQLEVVNLGLVIPTENIAPQNTAPETQVQTTDETEANATELTEHVAELTEHIAPEVANDHLVAATNEMPVDENACDFSESAEENTAQENTTQEIANTLDQVVDQEATETPLCDSNLEQPPTKMEFKPLNAIDDDDHGESHLESFSDESSSADQPKDFPAMSNPSQLNEQFVESSVSEQSVENSIEHQSDFAKELLEELTTDSSETKPSEALQSPSEVEHSALSYPSLDDDSSGDELPAEQPQYLCDSPASLSDVNSKPIATPESSPSSEEQRMSEEMRRALEWANQYSQTPNDDVAAPTSSESVDHSEPQPVVENQMNETSKDVHSDAHESTFNAVEQDSEPGQLSFGSPATDNEDTDPMHLSPGFFRESSNEFSDPAVNNPEEPVVSPPSSDTEKLTMESVEEARSADQAEFQSNDGFPADANINSDSIQESNVQDDFNDPSELAQRWAEQFKRADEPKEVANDFENDSNTENNDQQLDYQEETVMHGVPEFDATATLEDETFANESVADVLARMRANNDLPAPAEEASMQAGDLDQFDNPAQPTSSDGLLDSAMSSKAPGKEGEPSVQEYMNQLLNRLNGEPTTTAPVVKSTPEEQQGNKKEIVEPEPIPEPVNPLTAEEYIPQQAAPEKQNTLDNLRQLANDSTRSAVNKSIKKKNIDLAKIYGAAAFVCLLLAGVCMWMTTRLFDSPMLIAIGFIVASVFCAVRFMSSRSVATVIEKKDKNEPESGQVPAAEYQPTAPAAPVAAEQHPQVTAQQTIQQQ